MTAQLDTKIKSAAADIRNAPDLWDLHQALIAFESALQNATDEDGTPVYFNHRDVDTEGELSRQGIDLCALPTFGGKDPRSTDGVWSWDESDLLVGEGPFKDWRIVDREEYAGSYTVQR